MPKRPFLHILPRTLCVFMAAAVLIGLSVSASAAFRDVPPDHWCAVPIGEMERRGILAGYPDGTFRPGHPVTAAQFVVIVTRCAAAQNGQDPLSGTSAPSGASPWAGAAVNHWAADAMGAALQSGWYDWDELPPTGERYDLPVSRVLAVKILMRALLPDVRGDYLTESAKIRDFAALDGRYYESTLAAYACGVAQGDSAGNFNPHGTLTRAAACAIVYRALQKTENPSSDISAPPSDVSAPPSSVSLPPSGAIRDGIAAGGVSENGWLQVRGAQLCNEAGEPVILRGMSSHGLQWYGQFATEKAIRNLAARGANLFRLAMYTGEGGYLSQRDAMREKVIAAADAAVAQNLYVIIDWHILSDGNPSDHTAEAVSFFSDMAARYRDCPAVLYEICNEPNGNITWERDIRPYALRVIGAIREQSPRAVILVGSGTWSQDIHEAARSPIDGENLMYTFHFYAGTHGADLQNRLRNTVSGGLPVFVSEWGTSRADGGGGVYPEETEKWLALLDELGISWANWSLCDKDEASAALKPGVRPDTVWTDADLSASGKLVFARFADGSAA